MNMPTVPEFRHVLHRTEGKDERLNWIVSEVKKKYRLKLKNPSELQKLEIEYFIEEHCRALRLARITRIEYRDQVLFEIGLKRYK